MVAVLAEQTVLGVSCGTAAVCECLGASACVAEKQRYRSADSSPFLQLQLLAFGKTLASQALEPLPPSCKRVGAKRGA